MPTFRNDADKGIRAVENTGGANVLVAPGETVQTYTHLTTNDVGVQDTNGWTKTAETPRWNPVVAEDDVTSTGDEVTINSNTKTIIIVNDSSDVAVDVSWGATANTPATPIPAGSRWEFADIEGLVDKLIFTFSGSLSAGDFRVVQMQV